MAFYTLIDSFDVALGDSVTSLDEAKSHVEELGEAAGEVTIVETQIALEDSYEMNGADSVQVNRTWIYDFIHEKFEERVK